MGNKRSLHLCILSEEISVHTHRWVLGLRGLGHQVDLITLRKDRKNDIGGISLNVGSKISYLAKIGAVRSLVRKLDPEILHSHFASSYGFLASFVDHPRKVLSVWGDDVVVFPHKNPLFKAWVKRSIRTSHRITATSHFLKEETSRLAVQDLSIEVVPFGIDTTCFPYYHRRENPVINIGIAKSLLPKYGIDVLINAFNLLSTSGLPAQLAIAGRGPYESNYKRLVRKLGLEGKVKFTGFIDHDEIPGFLNGLDIFVMPSISDGESFGVAALEASATGLPVVATRVGGVPEVVVDNVTGFLVERGNVHQLAESMEKLIREPALRQKMGQAGREFVEKKYRWEDNLRAMQNLYFSMVN